MTHYTAPLKDIRFALNEVLGAEALFQRLPGFESATPDIVDAVLDEAARFAEQVLAPINSSADQEGCTLDKASASVRTPKGFKEAYAKYRRGRLARPDHAGRVRRPGTCPKRLAWSSRR